MAKKAKTMKPAKKMKTQKSAKNRKALRSVMLVLLSVFLTVFLTAFVVGGYFFVNVMKVVGGDPVINLEEEKSNKNLTTVIYAYDKNNQPVEYARLHGEQNRIWLELAKMGEPNTNTEHNMPMIADAYIALEDKRFWEHQGVDWTRFIGVITKFGFSQGASTLTQQLIKNVTQEKEVTAIRKYNEILTAMNMERNYSKTTILEAYLNELYLGRGCYGVKTGAERYFGKDVTELNIAECAALAAITKAPATYDPINNPEKNRERQLLCLDYMLEQKKITQAQYDEAVAFKIEFKATPPAATQAQKTEINNYYVDFIIDSVISDLMKQKDMSEKEATRKVYYGGLKIYAAVDMDIQDIMEDVFRKRTTFSDLKGTAKNPINASMAVLDYEGRVVGIVGGAGEKSGNRGLNRAAQSWRQPGSTIKPLAVYGPAIEKNLITWSTMIQNQAFAYKGDMWPRNVDGTHGSGAYVTVQEGLAKSINTVAARIMNEKVKPKVAFDYLSENFGFAKLDAKSDPILPPMAVGAMTNGFSALEEAAAYAAFGNGGTYHSPFSYYRVTDNNNTVILDNNQTIKRSFSAETAKIMNEMLQTVDLSSYYTGNNSKNISKFKTFGKTGTTNDNKDRWFAGGTPYYVGAVWFGYDIPKDLGKLANPSAKIWMEVFNRIHSGLNSSKSFPTTNKAVQKSYCKSSGLLAGDSCASTAAGWYKTNNIPNVCASCTAVASTDTTTPDSSGGQAIQDWINQILGGG